MKQETKDFLDRYFKLLMVGTPLKEARDKAWDPIEYEFVECDTCRAKPGHPVLCNGCLRNRATIEALKSSAPVVYMPSRIRNTDWITRGRETYKMLVQKYHDDLNGIGG